MYKLYPYFTNDGSIGLFSPADDDIYHSTLGAATEAYEKFILPSELDNFFVQNTEIKVLDICFGIGYNTKSFINYFLNFEKKFFKISKNKNNEQKSLSPYNVTLYTDKISTIGYNDKIHTNNNLLECYNGEIYTDNTFDNISHADINNVENFKIYVKAIDTDKTLAFLSPFFISNGKAPGKNYKLPFSNERIEKYLAFKDKKIYDKNFITYPDELNIILLSKICQSNPEIFQNTDISQILSDKNLRKYFSPYICHLYKFLQFQTYKNTPKIDLSGFLHNIYYRYISKRYKKALNSPLFKNFNFDLKIKDARFELLEDNNLYDFIFLDAFTPAKCPALWTVDFFKLLFKHLNDNGRILTYSNSAAVRNAMITAGFNVGKIYNELENKFTGTIAVKNKALIKNELSEYDLGLLKTRAGIFYRDENLTGQNEAIIKRHKIEVSNSSLISSSKYIKQFKH